MQLYLVSIFSQGLHNLLLRQKRFIVKEVAYTCYNDIFEALALEPWLYNHCTDVPFITFALQGIQNEAERYRYLQWLKAEIQ